MTRVPAQFLQDLNDIRGLKQLLNQRHGIPLRFRQRLLFREEILEDTAMLHAPMDLHLVLLPLADITQDQANKVVAAARNGTIVKVEQMLHKGCDPNLLDSQGRSVLLCASSAGHVDIVSLLLEAGASKDAANDDGHTALHVASSVGRPQRSHSFVDGI